MSNTPVSDEPISVIDLMNVLLRHAGYLVIIPVAMALVFGLGRYTQPRTYEATATFLPQGSETSRSQMAGLASQLGLPVGADRAGEGPQFYAELLRTRELLEGVLTRTYSYIQEGERFNGTLLELYGIEGDGREARNQGIKRLRSSLAVRSSPQTGMVSVAVHAAAPDLAEAVAAEMLELLNSFNLQTRQSSAASEERFIAERMVEAEAELRQAEVELQTFLRGNRGFQGSPELVFEHERLQRLVSMRQTLYSTLAESYERARMSAVRNTPVLTVVEAPEGSAVPVGRRTVLWAIVGGLVGLVLAIVLAFVLDLRRTTRRNDRPDVQEFNHLRRQLAGDLRRPFVRVFTRAGR